MKKLCKRIISGVFAFVTLFFACMPPACALDLPLPDVDVSVDLIDFFDWASGRLIMGSNWFKSLLDKDVCPNSPNVDGYHNFVEKRTQVNGQIGNFYVCEYCGKSAGEVGQEAYTDYTATLPATGYNSDGNLVWRSGLSDLVYCFINRRDTPTSGPGIAQLEPKHLSSDSSGYGFVYQSVADDDLIYGYYIVVMVNIPFSGTYRVLDTLAYNFSVVSSGKIVSFSGNYNLGSFKHYNANIKSDLLYTSYSPVEMSNVTYYTLHGYCPVFEVVPDAAVSGDTYNIQTRPTTITGGNYGIIGDDGELNIITVNDSIVNETNNTYYNPVTSRGDTITSWSYDYSDRSYNLTLDTGDTVTVTYGDQNITIVEGGDTYIIYYVIDDGCSGDDKDDPVSSDSPAPSDKPAHTAPPSGGDTHEHDWQETSRKDPTCTLPGQVSYICENCGQSRVDVIPANGHTWEEKLFVPTQYDDNGTLIQQGFTVYECSVCGQQYKDETGAGPPGSNPGTVDDGGLIGWINNLIQYLSAHIAGASELILSFFRKIPGLFSGFTAFLSATFPYLPEEITMLLTFGIAAVVVIGIIKALRR